MGRGAGAVQMTYGGPGTGGNQNYSVYTPTDSYDDGYTGGPTGQPVYDGTVYRPQGPGAAGQGSYSLQVNEIGDNIADSQFSGSGLAALTFLHPALGLAGTGYDLIASTGGEGATLSDRIANIPGWAYDKVTSMPMVRIGGSLFRGELFSDTLEWLGDVKDSPWNPANWESGDPPEWSVYLPDGDGQRLIASGTLGRNETSTRGSLQYTDEQLDELQETGRTTGVVTSGGGTTNVTRKVLEPGDPGYIDYINSFDNPEDMDLPEGYLYDYSTGEVVDIRGNPYAYRIIDRSNAWKDKGIDDLILSDEEWANLSEEERQANFEARQQAAAGDPYNFGNEAWSVSPFGSLSDSFYSLNEDELRAAYVAGDISDVQLQRYLDDVLRSQGGTTVQQDEVNSYVEMLRGAGYSDEDLEGFKNQFTTDTLGMEGVRSREQAFNVYMNNLDRLNSVDANLQFEAYDLYDQKQLENYNNAFLYLDTLRGTDQFNDAYLGTDPLKRNAYLSYAYNSGTLSEEDYQLGVVQNLVESGESIFMLEDGRYALGTSIYEPYRILEFPTSMQREYTQEEINRARQEGRSLDPYNLNAAVVTNIDGASDEWNARRLQVAMLDNAGSVTFSGEQPAQPRPEKSRWVQFRDSVTGLAEDLVLDALTGGLYSAIPAGLNILKGEGNSEDWLAFTPVALEATGFITAPVDATEAARIGDQAVQDALARGYSPSEAATFGARARETALAGTGIELGNGFRLGYDQTLNAIQAATTGELDAFVLDLATPYVENQLQNMLGETATPEFVTAWQNTWSSIPEDVKAGLNKTFDGVVDGQSFEDAATEGVLKYLEESPFGRQIENTIKAAASGFDDNVLQPMKEFVANVIDVEAARAFLSNVDDEVLQPTKEEVQEVTEPVYEEVKETVEEVVDAIPEVDVDTPDVSVPEGPDVDDSGIEVGDLDVDLDVKRRAVGDTEEVDLYNELLKFQTEVGASPLEFIEYQDLLGTSPFKRTV